MLLPHHLGDQGERGGARHLEERQFRVGARLDERAGNLGVLEAGAETERGHPGFLQAVDVGGDALPVTGVNTQSEGENDGERPEELRCLHDLAGLDRLEFSPTQLTHGNQIQRPDSVEPTEIQQLNRGVQLVLAATGATGAVKRVLAHRHSVEVQQTRWTQCRLLKGWEGDGYYSHEPLPHPGRFPQRIG